VLPFLILFGLSLLWLSRVRQRRPIYLWAAYLLGGVATLAKGPAGIAMPVLTLLVFLVCAGRLRAVLGRRRDVPLSFGRLLPRRLRALAEYEGGLEILRGALIFLCVAAPWYCAMLARHGAPFWMELIGDNYVRRAQGRHGDRGTFDYYLRQLGAGLFPWSGVVATALLAAGRWLRAQAGSQKRQLVLLCLSWFVVDFMVVSLVNTKFHHYILPALPALAILAGLLIHELLNGEGAREGGIALALFGLPITWLSGRDLANFPARIGWLFNYDYVNAPGGGRPWPLTSLYGQRYEYGFQVLFFAVLALACTALLCLLTLRRGAQGPGSDEGEEAVTWHGVRLRHLLPLPLLLSLCIWVGPSPEAMARWSSSALPVSTQWPALLRYGFLVPAAAASLWLLWLFARSRARVAGGLALGLCGVLFTTWVLDRFLVDISPHWSQKHVFATYYRMRKGPEEPVVAWVMYWRGENFYTKNQIFDHRLDPSEKTVFLGDHNAEKLQAYLNSHRGRRVFFLLERHRLETLRGLLPAEARQGLTVVDDSNNKVYMAMAQL
jgi:hypothetical protein